MKKVALTLLLSSFFFAILVATAQAAESDICPGHQSLVHSKQVKDACYTEVPDYLSKCAAVVQQLASIESPTVQQRFDLAEAQHQLGNLEDDNHRMEELWAAAEHNYQLLHKSRPDDMSVLFHLQLFSEKSASRLKADGTRYLSEDFPYYHHMLTIAPDCSRVRKWLLKDLGFYPNYLSDIDQGWVDEISKLLKDGYKLSREKLGRMEFATMLFISEIAKFGYVRAKSFRHQVIRDLSIETLRYDDESRTANLNAICDYSAFHLQFTDYCLDAIRKSINHDISLSRPPSADVLRAISYLSYTFHNGSMLYEDVPIKNTEFSFLLSPDSPNEADQYVVRLVNILEEIPSEYLTFELIRESYRILGKNSKVKMLQQVISDDPTNQVAKSWLSNLIDDQPQVSKSR